MRIVISGGGTGGHVFPAIAIADAIMKLRPEAQIQFIGARGRIEMERVPKAGYPIEGLWISGFQRKLTLQNLLFPVKLLSSLWKAWRILKRFRPDVAVGVGGYASGPTLRMANRLGIPTLLQEQNSYPGVTNRILAAKAAKICVAYDGMERFFPKGKILVAGNPVRQDLENVVELRTEACRHFGLDPAKKTLVVLGGSLGARTINEAMRDAGTLLVQYPGIQVLWQAGKLYIDTFGQCATAQLPQVKIIAFIDRMDYAYAVADLVIGRAGALTISELCVVGKPCILVPSPNVAEDHQTKNASALVRHDAAIMVRDADAKSALLPKALEALGQSAILSRLSVNVKTLGKPRAAEEIALQVIELGRKRNNQ
jgi:UDP-N-acetylglucosamine--N-acetylmuramyl-(pentapeptide) pyrophosphoryl-undecaprenol N-acetylglucosamine transferase